MPLFININIPSRGDDPTTMCVGAFAPQTHLSSANGKVEKL